jgi:hypothetical protein
MVENINVIAHPLPRCDSKINYYPMGEKYCSNNNCNWEQYG